MLALSTKLTVVDDTAGCKNLIAQCVCVGCSKHILSSVNSIDQLTPWRNGSASDSRSEGCVFKSRRGHVFIRKLQRRFFLK